MAFKHLAAAAFYPLILACVCGIVFFANFGSTPFYDKGEPRGALVIRDIVLNGNWIFALKVGQQISSKPPLFIGSGPRLPCSGVNDGSDSPFAICIICEPRSISHSLSRKETL